MIEGMTPTVGAGPDGPTPPWLCPRCGARLVSRNMWHSCGTFSLEALVSGSDPHVLPLARSYSELLASLGDVQVIPQKTRLVAVARVRFAGMQPRKSGILVSFALHRWLDNPRVAKVEDFGRRWRVHHVLVTSEDGLDDELLAWLKESHDLCGLQSDLYPR